MHNARRSVCMALFVFLCVGLTSTALTFDSPPGSPPPPFAQDPGQDTALEPAGVSLRDILPMVEHWPTQCENLEKAGKTADASRCWWLAAEEIRRYATEAQVPPAEVRELRMQWLWRGARLSLELSKPSERAEPAPATPLPRETAAPAPSQSKSKSKNKLAKAKRPKAKSSGLAKNCKNSEAVVVKAAALPLLAPTKKQNVTSRYLRQRRPPSDRRREKAGRDCAGHCWSRDAASAGRRDAHRRACCGPLCICVLSAAASLVMEMVGAVATVVDGCR